MRCIRDVICEIERVRRSSLRPVETRRVVEQASSYLYGILTGCDLLCEQQVPGQSWPEQIAFLLSVAHSPDWSLTDDNRVTEFDGAEPD